MLDCRDQGPSGCEAFIAETRARVKKDCSVSEASSTIYSTCGFSADLMFQVFDVLGYGGVLVSRSMVVLNHNETALRILEYEVASADSPMELEQQISGALARLMNRAVPCSSIPMQSWSVVLRDTGRPLAMMQLPCVPTAENIFILMIDLNISLQPNPELLKQIFGLTGAEIRIAQHLAAGMAPSDLATELRLSRNTIRTQLASLMAKTRTRRQAELASLLARVSILPNGRA